MEASLLRVRLQFEDRSVLSKTQRSEGLHRSWLLIDLQQHRTISDVCSHLLNSFGLHHSCPNGIVLSMEGFALPPFELTRVLKDKEIICVKRKHGMLANEIGAEDADDLLDGLEDKGKQHVDNGVLLLANEEFDKETGGYQSESEEFEEDKLEDEPPPQEIASKKRKASTKLQSSKKKKHCLGVQDDAEDDVQTDEIDNIDDNESIPKKVVRKREKDCKSKPSEVKNGAETSNKKVESPADVKRTEQLEENAEEVKQAPTAANGSKKVPSRSARRKKAKRRWMREIAKISKKKPHPHPKVDIAKVESEEAYGRPKGLLHWKQGSKKPAQKNIIEQKGTSQNGDKDAEVVPVVIRPGHIRFEPVDEDEAAKQTEVSNQAFQWNGITSKKKGQKWGIEKFSSSRRNGSQEASEGYSKMLTIDTEVPVIDPKDFDKLPPCSLPKEGDVIAYRLLELSSSWTPELSSFRVGRISYYDARNIVLMPVPEYPIVSDKMDEDGPDNSPYGEDGTLEIKFSALVDVRTIKHGNSATKAVGDPQVDERDAAANLVSSSNENKENISKVSNPGDGEANPWDRLSKVLNAKNMQMPEANEWSKVGSGMKPCSFSAPAPSEAPFVDNAKTWHENNGHNGSCWGSGSSNAKLSEVSQEDGQNKLSSWGSWSDVTKADLAESNLQGGSSWGKPWSSFGTARGRGEAKDKNRGTGSSQDQGKTWSHGIPRGRGHGPRGRGRGRNAQRTC